VCKKNVSVATIFSTIPLNVSFRRGLVGNNLRLWHDLVALVARTRLHGASDSFIWGLHQNRILSIKSMYNVLIADTRVVYSRALWSLKLQLRIKNFMWYFQRGVVLTKDNLARRNWNGQKLCSFCSQKKMIQHIFFDCHYARFIWRAVQVTFNIGIPTLVSRLFSGWANVLGYRVRKFFLTEASTICWVVWTSRNEMVFDKSLLKTYMQVLY
jgi:hypothetical protein